MDILLVEYSVLQVYNMRTSILCKGGVVNVSWMESDSQLPYIANCCDAHHTNTS